MNPKPLDILFIEDCQEDIELAKEALNHEKVNNRLKIIDNGEDAITYLKGTGAKQKFPTPDLIVLDLNIPRKNGFEVLKEIVDDTRLNKIPLIVFTTSSLTKETLQQYKLDLRQYIRKSVDFHELVEAVKALEQNEAKAETFKAAVQPGTEELKILLIEDNREDAELIEELLFMKQKTGWEITHVTHLKDGLNNLKQNVFDLIILDLFLPDGRGLETLKKINLQNSSIPIVVTTSLQDEKIGKDAIREGAQDYLVKGRVTSDYFVRAVEYAIERKKLERLKDELLGYVNHELSNPLAVIKESLSQITEGLLGDVTPKQQHFLNNSISSIKRLIMITDDLLLCTKIELGKLLIQREKFNLVELADEIMESFAVSFLQKGLDLIQSFPSTPIEVYADRQRIGQVLTNLLNNALKYTPTGKVSVNIEEDADTVTCIVADTGTGIAPDDIPKLFKKYEQLLSHKRKGQPGTGLGLFICKTLTELHGGNIHVESAVGEGSRFIFSLPKHQRG